VGFRAVQRLSFWVGTSLVVAALSLPAHAVVETVVIERPSRAHKLAGFAVDPSSAAIAGADVDDCDSTFSRVLGSVTSDADGHFAFPRAKIGSTHYLSIHARGFNPLRITVKLRYFARPQLHVKLPIGG
jgi:hypothetical protein